MPTAASCFPPNYATQFIKKGNKSALTGQLSWFPVQLHLCLDNIGFFSITLSPFT